MSYYIAITGMKRTGSTWQANIVRILLEEQDFTVWMGDEYNGEAKDGYDVTLNKIHPFIHAVAMRADLVLTSSRNIYEVVRSWNRFKPQAPLEPTSNLVQAWDFWLMQWKSHTAWNMPFGMLQDEHRKRDAIRIINVLLGQSIEEYDPNIIQTEEIMRRANEEIVPPTDKDYDPKTLLFKNHITSK